MGSQKGLSYLELMVTMGLMGLLYLGSMHIIQQVSKLKKRGQVDMAKGTEITELRKMLSGLKDGLSWQNFDFNESYYLNKTVPLKVGWSLSDLSGVSSLDQMKFDVGSSKYLRSSHTLEVVDAKYGASVLFSRCINRSDKDKEWAVDEAYNLSLAPYLVLKAGVADVFCCPRGSATVCNTGVTQRSSQYMVRTFYSKVNLAQTKNIFKTYPLKSDNKTLDGVGFFFLFDKVRGPDSYQLFLFTQVDRCYVMQKGKSCDMEFSTKFLKLTGNIRSQGIHDSGFMEIN